MADTATASRVHKLAVPRHVTMHAERLTCTSPARCAPGQAPAGISYEP